MLADQVKHSEHFRERDENIKYIIIHCSAGTPDKQIETLNALGLSVHFIIGQDGIIVENLAPEKVAYHAGKSRWRSSAGISLNGCSIGIELESPRLGQCSNDYTQKQITVLIDLLKKLITRYNICLENILGHSDIAPTRKPDPGAGFPWQTLAKQGLGLWPCGQCLDVETDEQKLLAKVGYDTTALDAARYAFCRHYFPEEILIEKDIRKLVDNVYPTDFVPRNYDKYMKVLRAAAYSIGKNNS